MLIVTNDGSENQAQLMKWGLIPYWAKDPSIGNRMINAQAETIDERPMFRQAFQRRRCLVIADGFYEWMTIGKAKQPKRIILKSGGPFGFAGLWERWKSPEGTLVHSCTIITTMPNQVMEPIHNRMPVILPREAESLWECACHHTTEECSDKSDDNQNERSAHFTPSTDEVIEEIEGHEQA